ncbi:MAG: YifB family Mg chelatase-like AAA ATPase [Thermodesulfobacteriota bacterium]
MLAKIHSGAVQGVEGLAVTVEVDIASGLPSFSTVGLAEGAVRESKDRVKAAVKNSGYDFPSRRITVNLAPADLKKSGTAYDLPIAAGILAATGLLRADLLPRFMLVGELSLDGATRTTEGILPMALAARDMGMAGIIVPVANGGEAALVAGLRVIPVACLADAVEFLNGDRHIADSLPAERPALSDDSAHDFADVRGQEQAKRALEIAASGGHNVLMQGPPGSGKTMLARRLPTILPDPSFDEALETTKIYSVAGLLPPGSGLLRRRPFRAPHHTISDAGLIGGGQYPRPGEVSLAHQGVLFLDELPEFRRNVLEVLRQPLEDGTVTISRAASSLTFPSRFILVAAMNPCPCSFLGSGQHACTCTAAQIQRYRSRLSGPLLDRIDLHIEVPPVPYRDLKGSHPGESSAAIRQRVAGARRRQEERFAGRKSVGCNAQMSSRDISRFCALAPDSQELVESAIERFGLSARAYTRILKLARTIADLEESETIARPHVAEAIQYRRLAAVLR